MSTRGSKSAYSVHRQCNSAAERNKQPILETLQQYIVLPKNQPQVNETLLEISSGSGQHVVYLAKQFVWVTFQPTEFDMSSLESIKAYIEYENVDNVKPPCYLDVRDPSCSWLGGNVQNNSIDYVLNINMMHISDYKCTEGLFVGCGEILKPGKFLFTYGPYSFDGKLTPESNVRFNAMLRSQDSSWGIRDVVRDLEPLAMKCGLSLVGKHSLPANNHLLVWQKVLPY